MFSPSAWFVLESSVLRRESAAPEATRLQEVASTRRRRAAAGLAPLLQPAFCACSLGENTMSGDPKDSTPETPDRMQAQLLGLSLAGLFWLAMVLLSCFALSV
jgi:hypothetical protein